MSEAGSVPKATSYERNDLRPEEKLEDYLHKNPDLLLEEQVLLLGRQVRLDTGVADLVGLDQYGNLLVWEVKIARSGTGSASEETILSQPQTYARALNTYEYDDLNALYQEHGERLATGEWNVEYSDTGGGSLSADFEAAFGEQLEKDQFNAEQRMVVVAEEITRQTEQNAAFLLEQGLHFQCVELQSFESPSGDRPSMVASSTVVDYPIGRVRPESRPSPTYPTLVADILERAFPQFQSVVNVASLDELFPDGLDVREPQLVPQNEKHPSSVTYRLAVKPDDGSVVIAIDMDESAPDVVSALQERETEFEDRGLAVTGNQTYRVVTQKWEIADADSLDEELRDEIAHQYAGLVHLGYRVLTDEGGELA